MSFIINPYSFGSAFDPLSLSPSLWLSDTGSNPAVWPDLSGNGRNATQATTANQPSIVANVRNGRQIRRFDGVNDSLSASLSVPNTPFTIVMVTYMSSNGSGGFRVSVVMGTNTFGVGYNTTPAAYAFSTSGISITKARPTTFELISCVSNNASSSFTVDATTATGTIAPHSSSVFNIGTNGVGSFFAQDCAEILVFPTALNTTNRQAVESYLRSKWGTP